MAGENVTLTIDGREVVVPAGTLIIRAAETLGVYVPRFCDHPLLDPLGACRQCLVEVEGQRKPLTACTTPVAEGMVVKTQLTSDIARQGQEGVLEFLLINHPLDCPMCDKGGECPLQDQALAFGAGGSRYIDPKRRFTKPVSISPLVRLDRERCVLCARCTRFSSEIAGDPFIELFERGALEQVAIYEDEPYESIFSGNVIQICPVGALTSSTFRFLARPFDMTSTASTCNRCASGCAITVQERRGVITRVLARSDAEVNEEWVCDKGRFGYAYVTHPERVTEPLVRKEGEFVAVTLAEALRTVAERLAAVRRDGGTAAVLSSGQLLDEDAYALSRFARTVLGTNDVAGSLDATAEGAELLAALSRTAGATYRDIDRAQIAVVVGTDLQQESPILYLRVRRNARKRGLRVVEIGPRRSVALGKLGATWIPCAPGDETATVLGLAAALERRGGSGLDPLTRAAAAQAGVASSDGYEQLAATLADAGDAGVILAGEGLDPAASATIWNIALAVGARFGWVPRKAGARGAAWAGLHPGLLPGGRMVALAEDRGVVEGVWGGTIPAQTGRDAAAILGAPGALLLAGADPAADHPAGARALERAPFVVALDVMMNASARAADVVLPAVAAYERTGTLTDWEGRPRAVGSAVGAPGIAQTDHELLAGIAHASGARFPGSLDALRKEMAQLSVEQQRARPLTVPAYKPAPAGDPVRFATGRQLLDDGTMMLGADALRAAASPATVEVHPDDAARLHVASGDVVRVAFDGGATATMPATVTDRVARGVVFVPAMTGAQRSPTSIERVEG